MEIQSLEHPRLSATDVLITGHTYHRFQRQYNISVSATVFRSLCAYLFTIVRWTFNIPNTYFDAFICQYPEFEKQRNVDPNSSYHEWFNNQGPRWDVCRDTQILDMQLLCTISHENPYTFMWVEESLKNISTERTREHRCVMTTAQRNHQQDSITQVKLFPEHPTTIQSSTSSTSPSSTSPSSTSPSSTSPSSVTAAQFQALPNSPSAALPWHSEKALRDLLGLRDKQEFLSWLRQGWVLAIYDEYCVAELDLRRAKQERCLDSSAATMPASNHSSAKFLINAAAIALQSSAPRYCQQKVEKTNWTVDDHDIRLIVRLVQEGRLPGRWWDNQCQDTCTTDLCIIGYRLMCWLRYVHRLSTATSQSNQWQRAVASQWYAQLSSARAKWAQYVASSASAQAPE